MARHVGSEIELGITRQEGRMGPERAVLVMNTDRGTYGGVHSGAMVQWVNEANEYRCHTLVTDYCAKVAVSMARATQRNIDRQHAQAFSEETVAKLVEAAKAHYAGVWPPRTLNPWEGEVAK
jgi:F0F1-type ATP synthase gamma subunit